MKKRRNTVALRLAPLAIAVAALLATAERGHAQSDYCRQLQANYRAASQASGSGGNYAAIRRQLNTELARMDRENCRGLGIFRKRGANCPAISRNVQRLQQQLRGAAAGGGDNRAASLRQLLQRNGCTVPSAREAAAGQGVYRTLCVRTCDGYYFPISNSTRRARLKIDQAVCQAMYGGAPARLYVQTSYQDVARARSLDGEAYEDLETAFAYRDEYRPACQAELTEGLAAYGAEATRVSRELRAKARAKAGPEARRPPLPAPAARPASLGRDPETAANRAGDFIVRRVETGPDGVAAAPPMRRFGTNYYTAVETIPDLKTLPPPGRTFDLIGTAAAAENRRTSFE